MKDRLRELQMKDVADMQAVQTLIDAGIDPDEAAGATIGGRFQLSETTREALVRH
ncbi:hypothetical protein COLU111180_04305 [Cohnella lubricantis]|uniref:Uncharacterized protein n=1 Tax=Cohnella lubricantis TaxID=2163172 RepID=A0A841TDD8_9BACL|nr:hypothetical protein [Cohnella lubricantis]MBB6676471.1 hypothetical protein [Cohnella lubricantis]MBP2117088.1 hypothetical protein [Cohnella lubricantis]